MTPGRASPRSEVLKLLVAEGAIGEQLSASMLAWRHSGFSVHNGVRVRDSDVEGRKKLARYMLRAPLSLEKMTYLTESARATAGRKTDLPSRSQHRLRC